MSESRSPAPSMVSVIIPVHNGGRFLESAVRNVLEQQWSPLEIIVIDDGSTDDTAEVAKIASGAIHYVHQERRGPAAARNRGIRMARGAILAFLDVDDAWPAGRLRRQMAFLAAHPDIAIVQGLIVQMQLDRSSTEELVFEECSEPYQFVNLGSALFRVEAFDRVGLFDETLTENEDTDWFFRAWERTIPKVVQDQVALFYRRHTQNITLQQRHPSLRIVGVLKRHLDRCRAQEPADEETSARPTIAAYIGAPPAPQRAARVADAKFSIISNDCWGGGAYGHAGLMYRTPFIGTRILAPCFLRLLSDLRGFLSAPLAFIADSRYPFIEERRAATLGRYPIALLHGAVEVHFVHEPDEATAARKWERRLTKLHWDNLYIKFSQDPEACTEALLEEFDRLHYPYKVCFTYREYPALRSTVFMPDYFVAGAPMYFLSRRYFDSIGWLNKLHGPDTRAYRLRSAATP